MKKFILIAGLLSISYAAYAACTTTTIMQDGRTVICTTCCDSFGNCTVNCF